MGSIQVAITAVCEARLDLRGAKAQTSTSREEQRNKFRPLLENFVHFQGVIRSSSNTFIYIYIDKIEHKPINELQEPAEPCTELLGRQLAQEGQVVQRGNRLLVDNLLAVPGLDQGHDRPIRPPGRGFNFRAERKNRKIMLTFSNFKK